MHANNMSKRRKHEHAERGERSEPSEALPVRLGETTAKRVWNTMRTHGA